MHRINHPPSYLPHILTISSEREAQANVHVNEKRAQRILRLSPRTERFILFGYLNR